MTEPPKVTCRTPTAERDGTTQIPKWKYDSIRQAILDVIETAPDGQIAFSKLADLVSEQLSSNQLAKLGSVKWHVTTVKLNMEVDGEIERLPRRIPQILRKVI